MADELDLDELLKQAREQKGWVAEGAKPDAVPKPISTKATVHEPSQEDLDVLLSQARGSKHTAGNASLTDEEGAAAKAIADHADELRRSVEGSNTPVKETKSVAQQAYERQASRANQGKFNGGAAESTIISALNQPALGLMPQTLAAGDALNAIAPSNPRPIESLSDIPLKIGDSASSLYQGAKSLVQHPVDTFNKAKEVYNERVPEYRHALDQKTLDRPYSSFAGGLVGSFAGLPRSIGQAAVRGAVGALGATEHATTGDLDLQNAKSTALNTLAGGALGAAGFKAPFLTGAAATAYGVHTDDPQMIMSGVAGMGGGIINQLGQRAATGRANAEAELAPILDKQEFAHEDVAGKAERGVRAEERAVERNRSNAVKFATSADQSLAEKQSVPFEKFFGDLDEAGKAVKGVDKLSRPSGNSSDAATDPRLTAEALLGNEAKEGQAFLRSKDPLKLKFTPEAEQGIQALIPDYEAKANAHLAKFAQGKDARLQQILAEVIAKQQQPQESVSAGPNGEQVVTSTPTDLSQMSAADLLKQYREAHPSNQDVVPQHMAQELADLHKIDPDMIREAAFSETPNTVLQPEQAKFLAEKLGIEPKRAEQVVLDRVGGARQGVGGDEGTFAGSLGRRQRQKPAAGDVAPHDSLPDYTEQLKDYTDEGPKHLGEGIARDQFSKLKSIPDLEGAVPEAKPNTFQSKNPLPYANELREYLINKYSDRKNLEPLQSRDQRLQGLIDEGANPLSKFKEVISAKGAPGMLGAAVKSVANPEFKAWLTGKVMTAARQREGSNAGQGISSAAFANLQKSAPKDPAERDRWIASLPVSDSIKKDLHYVLDDGPLYGGTISMSGKKS